MDVPSHLSLSESSPRMIRTILSTFIFLFLVAQASAQQFSITAGTINTCAGVMEDSGGPSGSYGNNEDFTVVICPDQPGDAISLNWVVFSLSQQLPNPLDRIRIWDGNSTAAAFLGEYTGTALQGLITSATMYNASGCLTVQFLSNSGGVGNFAAGITCFTPCEHPTAVASMSELSPAKVCVGEPVSFNGLASFAAPTFTIAQYKWDFDDGDTLLGPTATHSFAAPGEYMVQLHLVDDNGCVNTNMVDLQVLVSTTPSFAGTTATTETCLGATVNLHAVATPVTWTGLPDANFGNGVYLPDDLGIPFTSDLLFTQFNPGQVVNSISDIQSICVNMEHSFMGDLVLQISCPNGQTQILHQQGGGSTYIGGANDNDGVNPTPGTCWQYCWSPGATWGTWADCSSGGPTPHVMMGGTPPSNALDPGTYTPVQPFSNLIGCPLNGTWTFTVTDLWAIDNGFLCDWSLNFNPAIIPDATQFTPVLGSTIDSAGWSGPFLTVPPVSPYNTLATPDSAGTFQYVFHVTDDFGCTYDTTLTVVIAPQMVVDAGPAITLCNDSLPMAGVITANGPPNTCTWTITLIDSWGDGWNGGGSITVTVNGVSTNYTNNSGGGNQQTVNIAVPSGATMTISYNAGTSNNENSYILRNDLGNALYTSPTNPAPGQNWTGTVQCGGAPPVSFQWSPAAGLADPSDPGSMVWVTDPTWYTLAVYPAGHPECAVTDSVLVSPPAQLDPGQDGTAVVCQSSPAFLMTDSLGGTPEMGGVWTSGGATMPATFTPLGHLPGQYPFTYTVTSPLGCVATAQLNVTVIDDTNPVCCGIPDAGLDNYSCNLTISLHATPGNTGVGVWSGPPGAVFADAYSPITTVTMPPGGGGSHWFYWRENDGVYCNTVDSVRLTFTDPIVMTFTTTDAVCFGYCDGEVSVAATGGNVAQAFQFQWSAGTPAATPDSVAGLCAGTFQLTLTDDNGCSAVDSFTIAQPVLLQIDSIRSNPVTCSGYCDGSVMMQDAQAVAYSFNGGASWSDSTLLQNACEGLFQLRIRDAAGCLGVGSIMVTGPPPVEAGFEWGPTPANVDNPILYFHNTSSGAQRYFWEIAHYAYSTSQDTVYVFPETAPGVYPVCLTAFNFNNCADTICQDVTIEDVLEPYVPNAFTPNGDGHNDVFLMSTNIPVITQFEMLIYDRWGQLVFLTNDPYQPWLGSYKNNGAVLAQGVYVYRIRYEIARTQAKKELLGHVTLLK